MNRLKPVFYKKSFEDLDLLEKLNEIFKLKRNYNFQMPPKNSPVVLALSGGLDSIMLWYILLEKFNLNVYPIHFLSSKFLPSGEKKSTIFFSNFFRKKYPNLFHYPKFDKPSYKFLFSKLPINRRNRIIIDNPVLIWKNLFLDKETQHKGIIVHNSFLRTNYFIVSSYEYALFLKSQGVNIDTVILAMVPEDAETTRESTLVVLRSLNIYLCTILDDWRWQIIAPIDKKSGFFFPKKQLIKIANNNNFPIEKTWSCHNNFFWHCGRCKGCLRRQMAFEEAHIADPTYYFINTSYIRKLKKIRLSIFNFFHFFKFKKNKKNHNSENKKIIQYQKFEQYYFLISEDIKLGDDKEVGYLLFNKKNGHLIKINKEGYFIISLIKTSSGISGNDLLKSLEKKFNQVKREKLKKDTYLFLKKLLNFDFGIDFVVKNN